MVKYSLKRADAVFLDSDIQEKAAIELGCKPDKIVKFPWFDLDSLHVMIPKLEIRDRLGWRNNPIVISTRSHEPIYGVEYLIEAIPHVLKQVPESRFLIVGKGQLTQNLQTRAKELGVDNNAKFVGSLRREELISYLNASDLNVTMSMSDGTSASLLEAMALGVPTVATAIPGNKEWVKNGLNGFVIPVRDVEKLTETIVMLLRNDALRRELGEKSVETVRTRVDWSKTSRVIDELVSKLIHNKTERSRWRRF